MSTDTGTADGEHAARLISTVAGTATPGAPKEGKELALSTQLNGPYGVTVDRDGTLYISEFSGHRVRKVSADGKISTVAGTGVADFGGDGEPAALAKLNGPRGLAVDSAGDLYIADSGNRRVRKITMADGNISTFAGTGAAGSNADGILATDARLNDLFGLAVDSAGDLYIADCHTHRVRKVTMADGKIRTVAGTGAVGSDLDGILATDARLNCPRGVAVDSAGVVYIADTKNHRVRKVAADGKISTFAGRGEPDFGGDGGAAKSAQLNGPHAVAVDGMGVVYIADAENHRVRKVAADGTISTFAGTGKPDFGGDDGPAGSAQLNNPFGLALNSVDTLYIADHINNRIRKMTSPRLPKSGTVVCWANARSRLRMAVVRESTKDGAEIQQTLPVSRGHQRWRLVVVGEVDGEALYRIENVRSGKALEVVGGQERPGAVIAQRAYEGDDAHHQQWRLIPVDSAADAPYVYEIANRNSGLYLRADTNARTAIRQDRAEGDDQGRQWQLLPA